MASKNVNGFSTVRRNLYNTYDKIDMVDKVFCNPFAKLKEDKKYKKQQRTVRDKDMDNPHRILPKGTVLRFVRYIPDSRIFSFVIISKLNSDLEAFFKTKTDEGCFSFKEDEFEWVDKELNPLTYYEDKEGFDLSKEVLMNDRPLSSMNLLSNMISLCDQYKDFLKLEVEKDYEIPVIRFKLLYNHRSFRQVGSLSASDKSSSTVYDTRDVNLDMFDHVIKSKKEIYSFESSFKLSELKVYSMNVTKMMDDESGKLFTLLKQNILRILKDFSFVGKYVSDNYYVNKLIPSTTPSTVKKSRNVRSFDLFDEKLISRKVNNITKEGAEVNNEQSSN